MTPASPEALAAVSLLLEAPASLLEAVSLIESALESSVTLESEVSVTVPSVTSLLEVSSVLEDCVSSPVVESSVSDSSVGSPSPFSSVESLLPAEASLSPDEPELSLQLRAKHNKGAHRDKEKREVERIIENLTERTEQSKTGLTLPQNPPQRAAIA